MIKKNDLQNILEKEIKFNENNIILSPFTNYISKYIMKANGSVFTNKYAEGYPEKRYYGGCINVDKIEKHAINLLKIIFKAEHANIQPHSRNQAMNAILIAFLSKGDKVLSFKNHLNDNSNLYNFKFYSQLYYSLDENTGLLNYKQIKLMAQKHKPKMIIANINLYPRIIDWAKIADIAEEIDAIFIADISDISGLIVTEKYLSPVWCADAIVGSTNMTLRGPQGGFILCKKKHSRKIDKALFPGIQGGPHMNFIFGKTLCFLEIIKKNFIKYNEKMLKNAYLMCNFFKSKKIPIIFSITQSHFFIINVKKGFNIDSVTACKILKKFHIICTPYFFKSDNKSENLFGIIIGTGGITTIGYDNTNCLNLAHKIYFILKNLPTKNLNVEYLKIHKIHWKKWLLEGK